MAEAGRNVELVRLGLEASAVGRESGVPVEMDIALLFEACGGRATRFQVHPDRESALGAI